MVAKKIWQCTFNILKKIYSAEKDHPQDIGSSDLLDAFHQKVF